MELIGTCGIIVICFLLFGGVRRWLHNMWQGGRTDEEVERLVKKYSHTYCLSVHDREMRGEISFDERKRLITEYQMKLRKKIRQDPASYEEN